MAFLRRPPIAFELHPKPSLQKLPASREGRRPSLPEIRLRDPGQCRLLGVSEGARFVNAPDILLAAASAISAKAAERDQPLGERTAARAARIFNAITGRHGVGGLNEHEAWFFMVALKLARAQQGAFQLDDYVDGAAYIALAGECAASLARRVTPPGKEPA